MSIEGLRFVITGAGNGIGAGTAIMAASRRARVVLADVNDAAGKAAMVAQPCIAQNAPDFDLEAHIKNFNLLCRSPKALLLRGCVCAWESVLWVVWGG